MMQQLIIKGGRLLLLVSPACFRGLATDWNHLKQTAGHSGSTGETASALTVEQCWDTRHAECCNKWLSCCSGLTAQQLADEDAASRSLPSCCWRAQQTLPVARVRLCRPAAGSHHSGFRAA